MSKKKKTAVAALIVLGIVVVGLAAGVYAKYIASLTKTGGAEIAKWAFSTDNTTGTITCELDKTYTSTTLSANKIAPGTSGKCPISVSNANSDVGVHYIIKPKTVTNQPSNLKFYTDEAHTVELTVNAPKTGDIAPKTEAADSFYIYWYWPYESETAETEGVIVDGQKTSDNADTTNGVAAGSMSVTFEIQGIQTQPTY